MSVILGHLSSNRHRSWDVVRALSKIHTWPLTLEICLGIRDLDFSSDPADEIIASTSIVHRVPLVTRDGKIRKSKIVPLATVQVQFSRASPQGRPPEPGRETRCRDRPLRTATRGTGW